MSKVCIFPRATEFVLFAFSTLQHFHSTFKFDSGGFAAAWFIFLALTSQFLRSIANKFEKYHEKSWHILKIKALRKIFDLLHRHSIMNKRPLRKSKDQSSNGHYFKMISALRFDFIVGREENAHFICIYTWHYRCSVRTYRTNSIKCSYYSQKSNQNEYASRRYTAQQEKKILAVECAHGKILMAFP